MNPRVSSLLITGLEAKQRTENSGRYAANEEADEHQGDNDCYEAQRIVSRIATKTNVAIDIATNANMYDQSVLPCFMGTPALARHASMV